MNLHNLISVFLLVFFGASNVWSQTTSTIDVHRGVNVAGLIRQDSGLATIEDLCARTDSPFVAIARGQKWQTILRGTPQARATRLTGNQGYVFAASLPRTILLTGTAWGTEALVIHPQPGITLFVHQRPNLTAASVVSRALGAQALFRARSGPVGLLWDVIALPPLRFAAEFAPLERGAVYAAIMPSGVSSEVVLPNSDQPPTALTNNLPVSATIGTTLTLVSLSTDADDRLESLRHQWRVFLGQTPLVQSTSSTLVITPATAGSLVVQLVTSDGLATGTIRQSIEIVEPTASTLNEIQTSFGPFALNVFGIVGTLPRVLLAGGPLPPNPTGYRIAQESSALALPTGVEQLGLTRKLGYGNIDCCLEYDVNGKVIPLPLQLSVESGSTTDADLLVESFVYSPDPYPGTTQFSYYAFTDAIDAPQSLGKSASQRWRDWRTRLGGTTRRFTPVSLANLVSNRVGYDFRQVHPEIPLGRRTPVFLIHGFDPRSEFAPVGETFLQAQHRWDRFFGTALDSPEGIAANVSVLEKYYCFFLLIYPTTRSINEVAARLAELYERTIPEDAEQGVVIGYSEGGVVDMAWENMMVRGRLIGDRIRRRVGIAVPYHGSSVATALAGRFFDSQFYAQRMMPRVAWPLLHYGMVPPSDGLRDLQYDNTWKTWEGKIAYPTLNPTLSDLNSRDAFGQSTNVFLLVGATEYDLPFPNPEMETARTLFAAGVENEYSDAVAWTESTAPKDKFGSSKGDTDEFVGWRDDGTVDRVGVYWGFDHLQMFSHPDVICALHRLLVQMWDRPNHRPTDNTPSVVTLAVDQRSVELTPFATATDADGDTLTDHWTLWRTWPYKSMAVWARTATAPATLEIAVPVSVVMSHVVRDGRGMIAHKFVIVYRPMPPLEGPERLDVPWLEFDLSPRWDGKVGWTKLTGGEVNHNSQLYRLWIDPRFESTQLRLGDVSPIYFSHRWWSGRALYGGYHGRALNNGPMLYSNIAVGEPVSVHLLDR